MRYVKQNKLTVTTQKTDRTGRTVFSPLTEGLYLVFPYDEGVFAPFFVKLTEDTYSEPKADVTVKPTPEPEPEPTPEPEPDPGPEPTPSPDGSGSGTTWKKPAKTGDETPVELYFVLMGVGLAGVTVFEVIRRKNQGKR